MKTDAVKDFAAKACDNWLALDIPDIEDRLGVGLSLVDWSYDAATDTGILRLNALPGLNFESWAHRNWRWDGKFKIHVSWLPPDMGDQKDLSSHIEWENDYEIMKEPGKRPYVLDEKHGNLWMSCREESDGD